MEAVSAISFEAALQQLRHQEPATWMATIRRAHTEIKTARRTHGLKNDKDGNAKALVYAMASTTTNYYALRVVTAKLEYKRQLEERHLCYETRSFHIQNQLNKLKQVNWPIQVITNLAKYYNECLHKMERRIDCILNEIIDVAKLLGTPQVVPDDLGTIRRGGRDQGSRTAA